MKYLPFIIIVFLFGNAFSTNLQNELEFLSHNKSLKIEKVDNNILKLEYMNYNFVKYVNITDQNLSIEFIKDDMQVFDLPNTPDSLFEYRYTLKSRILLGQSLGYPILFNDYNNNDKLNIAGMYKIIQDHEIGQAGIMELQEDSSFTLQYLYTYSDSSIQPLASTDLDNDGLIELNIKRTQTFRNYESTSIDYFPSKTIFDHRMWQMSGMVGSETFTYIDDDSLMDVVYVGDDTLDPWGNKLYVAEYKSEENNFIQVYRFPPPEWRVSGISVGDFDGDGFKEIVTGSINGDIYIMENTGDNTYEHIYSTNVNTSNAYLNCCTNDIDKNGKPEFFIGASSYFFGESGTRVFWFEANDDNDYEIKREIFLKGTGVLGTTELYGYDVNADGVDDLVFAFEHYVVILLWHNDTQLFELYYLDYIDLGYSEIQSVTVYDVYDENYPCLFVSIDDFINEPRSSTFYYKSNIISGISNNKKNIILGYELLQNYPNPFNNTTKIQFYLPKLSNVNIIIYDLTGKEMVKLIKNQIFNPGEHSIVWNGKNDFGKDVSSGIYLYQLKTNNLSQTRKLIFIK